MRLEMDHRVVRLTSNGLCVILGLLVLLSSRATAGDDPRPNIVLIFIDDMGYGDISPFGAQKNQTPNLERMAAEGLKLTDFYVSAVNCTPSRAALLTGCYADRVGMDGDVVFPGDRRGLNPDEITIAEILKNAGYATGCFGKWHLGDAPEFMPLKQGFDEYEGIPYSNDMWIHQIKRGTGKAHPPLPYIKQDVAVAHVPDAESQALLCEATTRATLDFIDRNRDRPFFAYVPHAFVHLPRLVEKSLADRAEGNVTRAQIEAVDTSVGQIIAKLKNLGIAENTLVFFTSDNGPASGCSAGPLRGSKSNVKYEGSMRMPTLARWPGKIPAGAVCSEIACTIDLLPTVAGLCGGELPTDRVIDGVDITDLLTKPETKSPHSELFYEYDAVRQGNWKFLKIKSKTFLFDLATDVGETNDLSNQYPEKVSELKGLLEAHEAKVKSERRIAGFVDKPNYILRPPVKLPSLAEYLGESGIVTSGNIHKKRGKK